MAIALRHGFSFVRSETALFAGLRPEGPTPNQGNLAHLNALRNHWQAVHRDATHPHIYCDVRKKHTVFAEGLGDLAVWTDNLRFQKVEGAVLTGPATGMPVDSEELRSLRVTVDRYSSKESVFPWPVKLLVGSGVTLENLSLCRHYADALIVGSSLKMAGYWENRVDEERLARFMDSWHSSGKKEIRTSCPLVLSSTSPRRRDLLCSVGLLYRTMPPDGFEEVMTGAPADELVVRNAVGKAEAVAQKICHGMVIGCDTVIVLDDTVLGKPLTENKALETLRLLSGKTHHVISGLALVDAASRRQWSGHALTKVSFHDLSEEEIQDYVASGEPLDKAGAYAFQGEGRKFVSQVEGSESNIIGLPLELLRQGLKVMESDPIHL